MQPHLGDMKEGFNARITADVVERIEAWSKTGRILSYSLLKSSSED
jgi:hypothetical protein